MTRTVVFHVVYAMHVGGLERVLINTISRMPQEYEHIVICLTSYSESFASLLPKNTKVIALTKKEGQDFSLYLKFFDLLKKYKPQIVHSYNLATLELQVISWMLRVPLRIHAEHGRDIYDPTGSNKKYQWLRRLVSPFISVWVSVSEELHCWLQDTVKIPAKKTKLIRNGINTKVFQPAAKIEKAFVIGHVGRLSPIKNQKLLIEAFSIACNQNNNFANNAKLRIVGEGESRKSLEECIQNSDAKSAIELAGLHEDMPRVYQNFSVFVMSSLGEGIPMTLLEAMSCGIPPIVTDVGGMPEVVAREAGIIVPSNNAQAMADAFIQLYNEPGLHEAMMRASLELIQKKFDEEKMVSDYISLYRH